MKKETCPDCNGDGVVEITVGNEKEWVQCSTCHGKGETYVLSNEDVGDYLEK